MKNVLIVDDDEFNVLVFKYYLSLNTICNIFIAKNGLVSIKIFDENDIDLILMDINMPIMDGIEATKQIRLRNKKCIILACSAQNNTNYNILGFDGFYIKPIMESDFKEIIQKYL